MTHTRFWTLGGIIGLCLILLGSTPVDAQDVPTTSRREAIQDRMEERRDAIEEKFEERKAEIASSTEVFKERVEEHRSMLARKLQERLYNLTQNIEGRMEAAIFRLSHIADRIASRTEKLKTERNIDDAKVQEELLKARAALDAASALLSQDLGKFAYEENPREAFKESREALMQARAHLREAHEALRTALAALKDAISGTAGSQGVSEAVRADTATTTAE